MKNGAGEADRRQKRLYEEYVSFKSKTAEVEKIRKNFYDIMRQEAKAIPRTKAQDMEL